MPSTSQPSALLTAAHWIEALLTGPLAVSIAVIAVAGLGFMMLSGRLNVRRGAGVLIGCFIVFGAPEIARGLRNTPQPQISLQGVIQPTEAPFAPPLPTASVSPWTTDPHAGAALRK